MIKNKTAQNIASYWHGGQWSALYSFSSTGKYCIEYHLRYLQEIEDCLHPEYALYPGTLSKKDEKELNSLKLYFIETGYKLYEIETAYKTHPDYGYSIPYIYHALDTTAKLITPLQYLV